MVEAYPEGSFALSRGLRGTQTSMGERELQSDDHTLVGARTQSGPQSSSATPQSSRKDSATWRIRFGSFLHHKSSSGASDCKGLKPSP